MVMTAKLILCFCHGLWLTKHWVKKQKEITITGMLNAIKRMFIKCVDVKYA